MGHVEVRFGNAISQNSLFENQAFRSSFCIRTKKNSERRDCLFALPVNKKEVINQKNTFLFEFCSRSTLFGCCLFALPVEGKAVAVLKTRLICPRFVFALPVEGKAVTMHKNIVKRECSKNSNETSVFI